MQFRASRIGVVVAIIAVLGTLAVLGAKTLGENKMQRQVGVNVKPVRIALPHEAEWLERGRTLFNTRGCATCHGANGAGKVVVNGGDGMRIVAPNITLGAGSAVTGFRPVDWVRVLRHGVKRNDKVVMFMPSEDYQQLSNEDMGALVGYAMALPPVAGRSAVIEPSWPVLALYGIGIYQDAYEKIDHKKPALPTTLPLAGGR